MRHHEGLLEAQDHSLERWTLTQNLLHLFPVSVTVFCWRASQVKHYLSFPLSLLFLEGNSSIAWTDRTCLSAVLIQLSKIGTAETRLWFSKSRQIEIRLNSKLLYVLVPLHSWNPSQFCEEKKFIKLGLDPHKLDPVIICSWSIFSVNSGYTSNSRSETQCVHVDKRWRETLLCDGLINPWKSY